MKRLILAAAAALIGLTTTACDAWPPYHVWAQRQVGQAELARADGNRQIAIQEAKAKLESADFTSKAEVVKASGVAAANEIMAKSLGGPEGYLRWKYIDMLETTAGKGQTTIYVPTEANIPIMEAGRQPKAPQ